MPNYRSESERASHPPVQVSISNSSRSFTPHEKVDPHIFIHQLNQAMRASSPPAAGVLNATSLPQSETISREIHSSCAMSSPPPSLSNFLEKQSPIRKARDETSLEMKTS